jgi:hypothetical protein
LAVLVEGISVVVRCRSIVRKHEGGQALFVADLPNGSLRADGVLAALTFLTPGDAKAYVARLEERGLQHLDGIDAVDMVVVDQHSGLRSRCAWASFGTTNWNDVDGQRVSVCLSQPAPSDRVVAPTGWTYETSLTATGVHAPAG